MTHPNVETLLQPGELSQDEVDDYGPPLSNSDQRLRHFIRTCVQDGNQKSLVAIRDAKMLQVHHLLKEKTASARLRTNLGAPFQPGERCSVSAARALAALGMALIGDQDEVSANMAVFRRYIIHSGLVVDDTSIWPLPAAVQPPHVDVLRRLSTLHEMDLLGLVWAAHLDGWEWAESPGPRVSVLLDLGIQGKMATLSLSRIPDLPDGLVPDPRTMALTSVNDAFQSSLRVAWNVAMPGSSGGTVLWSLQDAAGPITRVANDSLTLAFSVLFADQARRNRPLAGRMMIRRQPRANTAIVGRIDPKHPAAASSVSGYDAKLDAIVEKTRVVLPKADMAEAKRHNTEHVELRPVATRRGAARAARSFTKRQRMGMTITALALVVGGVAALLTASESLRGVEQRKAAAGDLVARSLGLRTTNPTLAAKLGLTAHAIDPTNGRAVDALRDVLDENKNIARTWQADRSIVNSVAVRESTDQVITSGSEYTTKVWRLSTGALLGEIPGWSSRIAVAERTAMAAGDTPEGIVLYDIGDRPRNLGKMPAPTCASTDQLAAMKFENFDNTLVTVWKDGSVATYDPVGRRQKTCWPWLQMSTSLGFKGVNALQSTKVVSADIIGDDAVMLLTNNYVVSANATTASARIEVEADKITGLGSLVAATKNTISVATPQGVAAWQRGDQAVIVNPVGGQSAQPRVIATDNGQLLMAGPNGTAVFPIDRERTDLPVGFTTPRGGAATVAAVSGHTIVAGGPNGRISVITGSSGELELQQKIRSTSVAFLPDGRFVAAQTPDAFATTSSSGLALVDPNHPDANRNDPTWTRGPGPDVYLTYINDVATVPGMVAAAGLDGKKSVVLAWKWNDHKDPEVLSPHQPPGLDTIQYIESQVAFTPDGTLLVARQVSGDVQIWATSDWSEVATVHLKSSSSRMKVLAGHFYALNGVGKDCELVDVDLRTRTVVRRVPTPEVTLLAAASDGSRVATMTGDGAIQIYAPDLQPVGGPWRPPNAGSEAMDIDLDGSGNQLAVAAGDQTLVYDLRSQTLAMPPLRAENGTIIRVTWSPDSKLLVGNIMPPQRDGKRVDPLRVWKTGQLDWVSQVCRWTAGGLSPAEWSQYVGDVVPFSDVCAEAK